MLSQMAGGEGGKQCVLPSGSESGLLVLWSPVGRVGSFKQCSQSVSQSVFPCHFEEHVLPAECY